MCGISGKISTGSKDIADFEIRKMTDCIAHRGPDDEGIYISESRKVGLGHRRLSIIDLSKKGHQPMTYENRYVITFNGEIYNYKTEKLKLVRLGYKFRSNSDTEVLLALFDKYGPECLKRLRGFFAFAIYDKVKNTVFLARDRLGKKPLKYYFDGTMFIFASELKAILSQPEVHKSPDFQAINNYLTFGYVPAPRTGFTDIYKLEPGHYMILDIAKKTLTNHKYWQPDFSEKLDLTESEWKTKIIDLLEESVKLRMIADVPVGAFLSGGVDSSAVVALMAKNSNTKVKTFTIGFKEERYDETKYAKRIVEMYKTDHHEFIVEPEKIDLLPELVRQYEEPYANSSNIIAYLVSKIAREHVKVILNGDSADELFAGYDRYLRVKRDAVFDPYKSIISPLGSTISNAAYSVFKSKQFLRAKKYFNKSNLDFIAKYLSYINYLDSGDKTVILSTKFQKALDVGNPAEIIRKKFEEAGNVGILDKVLYFDLTTYFPDDLLTKVDIASMSVGLEARSPFMDHKLVEIACKIPFNLKVKGFTFKYILKKSLEDLVPKENLYRKKMGFSIPLDKWFTGDLNSYARSILLSKRTKTRGFYNTQYVKKMLDQHTEQNDFGNKLWALLTLELWFRSYFD